MTVGFFSAIVISFLGWGYDAIRVKDQFTVCADPDVWVTWTLEPDSVMVRLVPLFATMRPVEPSHTTVANEEFRDALPLLLIMATMSYRPRFPAVIEKAVAATPLVVETPPAAVL
jgi:hypothetical protein